MEPWAVALALTMAVGVAIILFGGLWDRDRNERRRRQLQAPPRQIPRFSPDQPQPRYLTDLQAAVRPDDAPDWTLAPQTASELTDALKRRPGFSTALLADEFITETKSGWAVAKDPLVLVTSAEVTAMRELLRTLEGAVVSGHPLVIVAAGFHAEVGRTLAANHVQGKLQIVPVTADDGVRRELAAATGATEVSLIDLRADSVTDTQLGHAQWWVAKADRSWTLAEAAEPASES